MVSFLEFSFRIRIFTDISAVIIVLFVNHITASQDKKKQFENLRLGQWEKLERNVRPSDEGVVNEVCKHLQKPEG